MDRHTHESYAGVASPATERHTAGMATENVVKAGEGPYTLTTNAVDPAKASDYMVGGSHYKNPDTTGMCPHCRMPVEHWDWSFNLRGLEYAATKYIARWRNKGGLESLKKAIHYVQKLINIHFPGVVVHVSYQEQEPNLSIRGGIKSCSGMAGGPSTHSSTSLEVGDQD